MSEDESKESLSLQTTLSDDSFNGPRFRNFVRNIFFIPDIFLDYKMITNGTN